MSDAPRTEQVEAAQEQLAASAATFTETTEVVTTAFGRQAFSRVGRTLSDDELKQTGTIKLLLDNFDRSERDCEGLRGYVERYHEADKRAAVLDEKVRGRKVVDVCIGAGGALVGLSISLIEKTGVYGIAVLIIGLVLIGAPMFIPSAKTEKK